MSHLRSVCFRVWVFLTLLVVPKPGSKIRKYLDEWYS